MNKILITSYTNPDIDGSACMYAYEQLLRKLGKNARAGYFGQPQADAVYAFERCGVVFPERAEKDYDEIILVDTNNILILDKSIDTKKVVEIYDHHEDNTANFPNLKRIEIKRLGAAATLIASRFKEEGKDPDEKTAKLLGLAIIHGTVLFQAKITSRHDHEMYEWLNQFGKVTDEDIDGLLKVMTRIAKPFLDYLRDDFKLVDTGRFRFGIAVSSTMNLDHFRKEKRKDIMDALTQLKDEKSLDYIWFGCVDLKTGKTWLLAHDDDSENLLAEALDIRFNERENIRNEIALRKEDLKKVKEYLDKK